MFGGGIEIVNGPICDAVQLAIGLWLLAFGCRPVSQVVLLVVLRIPAWFSIRHY
jgi:hypothetical protein